MIEYDVSTLADIARIPEDRLPAFIEELPQLLKLVRQSSPSSNDWRVSYGGMVWIDDGKTGVAFEVI